MFNPLLPKLADQKATTGIWVSLESPSICEVAIALNLDWVVIDMEHGHLGLHQVMAHVRAFRGSETCVLVRVPNHESSAIKRVLDMGAHGVLLPLIRARSDLDRAMRTCMYPPRGVRGVGGERAVHWGLAWDEYLASANDEILVVPLVETKEAVDDISRILSVDGLRAIFFGPADLSASYGYLGAWEGPGVAQRILEVAGLARERGIATGIIGRGPEDAQERIHQGFRMVGLGSDVGLLIDGLTDRMKALGMSMAAHLWF